MARWISKFGNWVPAKEKVALKNLSDKTIENPSSEGDDVGKKIEPGEPYIYQGPCRAALFELWQQKVETLGMDYKTDPELIARVRQLGYKSITAYEKAMSFDRKKAEEEFDEKASPISKHELPKKVKAIDTLGGGKDFSGQGHDKYGGFGEPDDLPKK